MSKWKFEINITRFNAIPIGVSILKDEKENGWNIPLKKIGKNDVPDYDKKAKRE